MVQTIANHKLQNFYDSAYFTNIGLLTSVDELIADSLILFAGILNSYVSPINHFEENAAIVNELYLTCCINGDCVFDSTQYATLYAIASENPYSGGDAVYTAREMIDLMFDDYLTEPAAKFSNLNSTSLPMEISVHPNPSKNYFDIDLNNLGENDKWDYTITNYLGGIVTQERSINSSNIVVNATPFQQGVYLLQVILNNQKCNFKVIVIK